MSGVRLYLRTHSLFKRLSHIYIYLLNQLYCLDSSCEQRIMIQPEDFSVCVITDVTIQMQAVSPVVLQNEDFITAVENNSRSWPSQCHSDFNMHTTIRPSSYSSAPDPCFHSVWHVPLLCRGPQWGRDGCRGRSGPQEPALTPRMDALCGGWTRSLTSERSAHRTTPGSLFPGDKDDRSRHSRCEQTTQHRCQHWLWKTNERPFTLNYLDKRTKTRV